MAAKRPIEDFFCNPTHNFAMEEHPRYSMASEPVLVGSPMMPPSEMFSFKAGIKTPEPSAAIRHFTDEPMFWRGYTSEEEVASPIDTDDRSFRTTSTFSVISQPASRMSDASFPEQLAESCERVERQCEKGQSSLNAETGQCLGQPSHETASPDHTDTPSRVTDESNGNQQPDKQSGERFTPYFNGEVAGVDRPELCRCAPYPRKERPAETQLTESASNDSLSVQHAAS